jgi:ankyrin repeat protein
MKKVKKNNFFLPVATSIWIILAMASCNKCGKKEENEYTPIDESMIEAAAALESPGGTFLSSILKELKNKPPSSVDSITNKTNPDDDEKTALHYAAELGISRIIKALTDRKADVNKKTKEDGDTPLICAARSDKSIAIEELLTCPGIDINLADKEGNTPLHIAVRRQNISAVKALLKANSIDVNKKNKNNDTPLACASNPTIRADLTKKGGTI